MISAKSNEVPYENASIVEAHALWWRSSSPSRGTRSQLHRTNFDGYPIHNPWWRTVKLAEHFEVEFSLSLFSTDPLSETDNHKEMEPPANHVAPGSDRLSSVLFKWNRIGKVRKLLVLFSKICYSDWAFIFPGNRLVFSSLKMASVEFALTLAY